MSRRLLRLLALVFAVTLVAAACGSDSDDGDATSDTVAAGQEGDSGGGSDDSDSSDATGDRPTIAVTTNILGDVVTELVGDQADIVTIMPVGADPHDFQASAQEVDAMLSADALITNGASFEEGLLDVIDNATDEGVPTHEATEGLVLLEFGEGGHDHGDEHDHDEEGHSDEEKDEDHDHSDEEGHDHDEEGHSDEEKDEDHDHGDEEHSDEEGHDHDEEGHSDEEKDEDHDHGDEEHSDEEGHDHGDEDGHDHSGDDPHFFTSPVMMAGAVGGIAEFLGGVDGIDAAALDAAAADYIAELEALDAQVAELAESIPEGNRVLITNHEVFAYFAADYDFEVVGTVIPSGSTTDGTSAGELAELAETIADEGVPAIFSDVTASTDLIDTLADEVGDIAVVELYTESLGEDGSDGATYITMVLTNAQRIAKALA